MAQYTVDLPCIADTYIDEQYPDTNYGSATVLLGGFVFGESIRRLHILLKFDHSLLPAHKRIVSIKLRVYITQSITAISYDSGFRIDRLGEYFGTGDWDEDTVTLNNLEGSTYNLAIIKGISYSGGSYYELNIPVSTNFAYDPGYGILMMWAGSQDNQIARVNSRESTNPPMLRVTYEDAPPNAPTPTEPIGLYKDSKSNIRFAWQYNSDVGGTQKAFDLQWSTDQSTWTTVSQTTANNYYDMPADTFPAGNVYWRVRCYNEYDEVGPYCDIQSFYAIGAPDAPVIGTIPTDTARPTVTWAAFSQQVYQLQVLSGDDVVYDSGAVPGINIRQHKIKAWLADGEHIVRIRIKNEYDLWSEWGGAAVAITTVKPDKPTLSLQRSAYGVEITGTGLVYRSDYDKDDYICIGTASGTYFDNTVRSKGEYKYFIRAVSENDTFEDSDIKFIQPEFQHTLIAPVSDLTNVFAFTRSLNAPPKRIYNRQPGGAFVEYAGRKHPVWEPTEHVNAAWQMSFYLKAWAEVEAFVALVDRKETVLYRDAKERKVYGVLGNLSVTDERGGYSVSFALTEVDHSEEVEV